VADCLNHTSLKKIHWQTPEEPRKEKMYVFWQLVLIFEVTAHYLSPNFLPCRFMRVARNYGDASIYRVWSDPDGDWSKEQGLIRNIVKPGPLTQDILQSPATDLDIFSQKKGEACISQKVENAGFQGEALDDFCAMKACLKDSFCCSICQDV
jgi:hypothetical protein